VRQALERLCGFLSPPHFFVPVKLLRSFFYRAQKTSYTTGTLNAIRPFSVLVIVAIDKNGEICKYYRAQNYPSLRALLARGLVTKERKESIRIMRLMAQLAKL
jgi:hypothetical protein